MRKIIIGDIHGCYDELIKLLQKIQFNKTEDMIVFLGDYTDRGPKSYEVYLYIKQLKEFMGERCILIYGNHEKMISDCIKNRNMNYWSNNGIEKTVQSFKKNKLQFSDYLDFINNNTQLYYVDEEFQACHAGTYLNNIKDESTEVLLWDRDCIKYAYYDGRLTFIGHTPVNYPTNIIGMGLHEKPQIIIYKKEDKEYDLPSYGLLALDTGCYSNGMLTAAVIENKKIKFFNVKYKGE